MELTDTQLQILNDVLTESVRKHKGINALEFRAARHTLLDKLDELENEKYLIKRDEKYYLQLAIVVDLKGDLDDADFILMLCGMVYEVLKKEYQSKPGKNISLNEVGKKADLPRNDINKAISYLVQIPIYSEFSGAIYTEDASIKPSESLLRYPNLRDMILNNRLVSNTQAEGTIEVPTKNKNHRHDFIDKIRIEALKNLESKKHDFSRLLQMCYEMNSCSYAENYIALGALIRILIDHIPPILGFDRFQQVAANYPGKSLKQNFEHLEKGARKIADQQIHQTIRKKEVLPTFTMVNYSQNIDLLLGEIIRKVNEENA